MSKPDLVRRNDLHALDLSEWASTQVRALRERRFDDLDRERISDLLGDLARRERGELRDRLGVVLVGLLRWAEQVDLRCHGWAASIDTQRHRIEVLLRDNPSLQAAIPTLIADAYPSAKARAVLESALFDTSFPEACPFTQAEILTYGSYPDPHGDDPIRGEGWWKRGPT